MLRQCARLGAPTGNSVLTASVLVSLTSWALRRGELQAGESPGARPGRVWLLRFLWGAARPIVELAVAWTAALTAVMTNVIGEVALRVEDPVVLAAVLAELVLVVGALLAMLLEVDLVLVLVVPMVLLMGGCHQSGGGGRDWHGCDGCRG